MRLSQMAPGRRMTAFLCAVFLLKLLVVMQLKDHPLTQPDVGLDTTAYATLARQVASGDVWLNGQAYFVSPLYIYFLGAGLAVTDSFTVLRILQIILGTASVGFIVLMGREWFSARAGWIAGSLAAVTGLFAFYESLVLQASLDVFLTSAALLALTRGLRSPRTSWFLWSGVIFGIATLNRPNMLAAAVAVAGAALVTRRPKPAALLLAGLLAGIAPVTIRNLLVTHDGSLVSSHGGLNFYIGNGEGATGFYRQVPGIRPTIGGQAQDTQTVASKALGHDVTVAEASDYFYDLAWAHIRQHPAEALKLFARKLGYVFHAQHIALPYSYPFFAYDERTVLRWYIVGPGLIIPLGLVGLAFLPADRSAYLVWASFIPAYAVSVALFFMAERYRLPILVPLVVGAGAGIDAVLRAFKVRKVLSIALPLAAFCALFAAVNSKQGLHDGRWSEGLRMAERLVILGRYEEAETRLAALELTEPQRGAARYAVALQLLTAGQPARAAETARQIVPADNAPAESWLRVGRLAAQAKAPAIADPYFERGAALAPDDAAARQQYGLNLLLLGRFERAAVELAAAVRLDPGDPESLAHLAYAEAKLGRAAEARAHAAAALAIKPDHTLARQLQAAIR